MLDLPSNDSDVHQFTLREQVRTVRGASRPALGTITSSIGLTAPLTVPLNEVLIGKDEELATFWASEKGRYRYDYITFRCDLNAVREAPFQTVWVEVVLEPFHDKAESMAWSVAPSLLESSTKIKTTAKLGAKFSIVSSEMASEAEVETRRWWLRARGEHTSRPYWELRTTETTHLEGTYHFHIIVRSTSGVLVKGNLSARAVVAERTFLIFNSEAQLKEPASVAFALPAPRM